MTGQKSNLISILCLAALFFMTAGSALSEDTPWDIQLNANAGMLGILMSPNSGLGDVYTKAFSGKYESSQFMFVNDWGIEAYFHYGLFGIGYRAAILPVFTALGGPGSESSGTYTVAPGTYSYWYDDGYYWYYYSYYDPGGTYYYGYGVNTMATEQAAILQYSIWQFPGSGSRWQGAGVELGAGKVDITSNVYNYDSGNSSGDFTYHYAGSAPMYIAGLWMSGPCGDLLDLGISLEYVYANVSRLENEKHAPLRNPSNNSIIGLDFSGIFLRMSFGISFGSGA